MSKKTKCGIFIQHIIWQKKRKILKHTTTCMNIKNIMLSEGSQTPNTTYCIILFICNVQNRQFHRDRKEISGCLGLKR